MPAILLENDNFFFISIGRAKGPFLLRIKINKFIAVEVVSIRLTYCYLFCIIYLCGSRQNFLMQLTTSGNFTTIIHSITHVDFID